MKSNPEGLSQDLLEFRVCYNLKKSFTGSLQKPVRPTGRGLKRYREIARQKTGNETKDKSMANTIKVKTTNGIEIELYKNAIIALKDLSIFFATNGERFLSWGNIGHTPQVVDWISDEDFSVFQKENSVYPQRRFKKNKQRK